MATVDKMFSSSDEPRHFKFFSDFMQAVQKLLLFSMSFGNTEHKNVPLSDKIPVERVDISAVRPLLASSILPVQ